MKRRRVVSAIFAFALLFLEVPELRAQSRAKTTVIGLLDAGERLEWWDAFRKQLRELGYVEGRNVRFEERYAKGNLDALPTLAKELAQAKVDVIVTSGGTAAVAAQRVTRKIPIVMASGTNQVGLGLAVSLARPGANVTGLSSVNSDLMAKRFELLREVVPKITRLAALWHADNTPSMASVREIESSAARSRVAFQSFAIRSSEELPDAFSAMARERVEAVIVINSPFIYQVRKRITALALKHKLPTMCGAAEYVDAGGLVSYAASYPDLYRRAALYVDKILKGANPGDLPIEQPTTFELSINARTALTLGITLPPSVLARADRVIQ